MAKIVLIPLDERPCNYNFPSMLYKETELEIVVPEKLGDKKSPADVDMLEEFVLRECRDADYAVIAMDTLLYGGLIPSRLHNRAREDVRKRLNVLRKVHEDNPKLKIYAFQCIMRCPRYSSSDEEPDYYGECGTEIHRLGVATHMEKLGLQPEYNKEELLEKIPKEDLEDYLARRKFNLEFNLEVLQLAEDGVVDFLIIPQDDSSLYGFTSMDQIPVRARISEHGLNDVVYLYPGADEIELTLFSRVLNDLKGRNPRVYVRYASAKAPSIIPLYEDRTLAESVKYHLMAAGCIQVFDDTNADFVLALSAPAGNMQESNSQPVESMEYDVERNITEFLYYIEYCIKNQKPVTVGDDAYANGGEIALLRMLEKRGLLFKVAGYAGWNTSANTIGTAVAQGVRYLYYGDDHTHREFLILRYLEDVGYCAIVRKRVTVEQLPALGMNYFDVREKSGAVSELVKQQLEGFADLYLKSIREHISLDKVAMPWRRMFETEIIVSYR